MAIMQLRHMSRGLDMPMVYDRTNETVLNELIEGLDELQKMKEDGVDYSKVESRCKEIAQTVKDKSIISVIINNSWQADGEFDC